MAKTPLGLRHDVVHSRAFVADGEHQGRLVDTHSQGIHLGAHPLHYATGVIEGMQMVRAIDGIWNVLFPNEHHNRLIRGGITTGMLTEGTGPTNDLFRHGLRQVGRSNLAELNPAHPMYLRPWLGEGSCELGVGSSQGPLLIIISRDKTPYLGDTVKTGVTIWAPGPQVFCRADPRCGFPMVKSVMNYGLGYKWKKLAGKFGAVEVLQYGLDGLIKETTGSNIFVVVEDVVYAPPLDGCILEGFTRRRNIEILKSLGIEVREAPVTRELLLQANEVFLTGTWSGVVPVRIILEGEHELTPMPGRFHDQPPGRITMLAQTAYNALLVRDLGKLPRELRIDTDWWMPVRQQ
ncbi:MAG: aminotransferase class IV [Candidatus Kerfeldbacteria bacterium]|nr:aminotransferase class IV [Candidatus Kerfeldbacteria bacterium]